MYEDGVNNWILGSNIYDRHRFKGNKLNQKKNAFKVYLCPDCNRVHENTYFNGEGRKTVYHEDFPTYKLKREACSDCEE